MFSVGDKIRVLVNNADNADVYKGDEFIIKDVNSDGEEAFVVVAEHPGWFFSFENIELVENA